MPLVFSATFGAQRPDVSFSGLLLQSGAGLVVGGAATTEDEEGHAEPSPLVFVAPPLGGTAGYALTRRAR